jgi:uncharacterized RDD family membrane protein YckC
VDFERSGTGPGLTGVDSTADRRSFAGLGMRAAALFIDLLVFCAVFFPVTRLLKGVWLMGASDHRWGGGMFITDPLCMGFLIVMLGYFVLLEGLAGCTIGKRAVNIRVVGVGGGRPGLARSLVRNLLRVVDGLPVLGIVGAILIITSQERARFGDRVAGTRVVKGPKAAG